MNQLADIDTDALIAEVTRYLAAVEVFRAYECEPTWLPEWTRARKRKQRPTRNPEPDRLRGPL